MNKGLSRLRQILILALRVLAVAAIILVVGRPLAGGWLGLTGGAPDTVLILLDRSASMEQKDLATGVSKRLAGLRKLAKAINDTTGKPLPPRPHRQRARTSRSRSTAPTRSSMSRRPKPPTPPPISPPCCKRPSITSPPTKPAAPMSGSSAICSRPIGTHRAAAGRPCAAPSPCCRACAFTSSAIRSRRRRSRQSRVDHVTRREQRRTKRRCSSTCASPGA